MVKEKTITTVDGLVITIGVISENEVIQKAYEEIMRQYGSTFQKLANL